MLLSKLFVPIPMSNDSFLFMNGSTWAQLWSGIIGAVVGSIAAALVASYVLRKTLAVQQSLAAEALELQRRLGAEATRKQAELADVQIREQRSALERQLAEQRDGLAKQLAEQSRLASEVASQQREQALENAVEQQRALAQQISEQRAEASKARALAAVADLVTATDELANKFKLGDAAIDEAYLSVKSAIVRWGLELDMEDLKAELTHWPPLLVRLAWDAHFEQKGGGKEVPVSEREAFRRLLSGTSTLNAVASRWMLTAVEARVGLVNLLLTKRPALEAEVKGYRDPASSSFFNEGKVASEPAKLE